MASADQQRLLDLIGSATPEPVVFLTGAGISAESGIPTFRGAEGFWRVGSVNYQPQELATFAAWRRMPEELWAWYLYRRDLCQAARPNAAHVALAQLEEKLEDRLVLVTQNVDGLHLRAGNSLARTYQIHGNIDFMRCEDECSLDMYRVPELGAWAKEQRVGDTERALLRCPRCHARSRPHVLWFDETYDEPRYRWDSSIRAAEHAAVLVVVGTAGATTLPVRMVEIAVRRRIALLVVNKEPSPFTELAERSPRGLVLWGSAGEQVPRVVEALTSRE